MDPNFRKLIYKVLYISPTDFSLTKTKMDNCGIDAARD